MNEPLISVVIPAFNAAPTLAESLRSVQSQTFTDFEVIVVDDGSTDETAEIAKRFCAADARFTLIRQHKSSCSVARNAAIARARADWIAFQDADDVWFPEKLMRQVQLIETDARANFIFTNLFFWDGQRDLFPAYPKEKPLPEGDVIRGLIFEDFYLPSSIIVRRDALIACGLFEPGLRLSQDWDMWLRMGENGLHARGIREPLVRYRRWSGNVTADRLAVADAAVQVLERNLQLTRHREFRPLYRRSIAAARATRELILASQSGQANFDAMSAATLRAWKCDRRLKWLRWYLLLKWPVIFGGNATRRRIQRKFAHKCRVF